MGYRESRRSGHPRVSAYSETRVQQGKLTWRAWTLVMDISMGREKTEFARIATSRAFFYIAPSSHGAPRLMRASICLLRAASQFQAVIVIIFCLERCPTTTGLGRWRPRSRSDCVALHLSSDWACSRFAQSHPRLETSRDALDAAAVQSQRPKAWTGSSCRPLPANRGFPIRGGS